MLQAWHFALWCLQLAQPLHEGAGHGHGAGQAGAQQAGAGAGQQAPSVP